ncbi:MAG TPA: peptidylprolyl isomerase [Spirochaetia bacterium]|jgi:FKBP-type peptidyl-prolyl cis-trans isomerase SlyD|nr:peptidylprolyl isomerase [Spirochaetia bacterium]
MKIAANKVATLHYTLKDDKGALIESSVGNEPLAYIHGIGNLIPGLEEKLEGKQAGDKVQAVVKPEDAYGERDEELIEEVDRAEFDEGEELEVGKEFQYDDEDGNVFHVRVVKVGDSKVTIDGNHPLAGQTLSFDVEVLEVREASKEELEHGHVHGEHGHHH